MTSPRLMLFLSALATASPTAASEPAPTAWNPGTTHVLIASVVAWPAKAGLAPFTAERRRDEDLAEQYRACGVPADQLIFLKDSAATKAGIRAALGQLAGRAGEGSTLVLYLQGHGSRKVFCPYDSDPENPAQTQLHMDEIFPILDPAWKGDRLFLIGDFCSSGSLHTVLNQFERRRPAVRVACLASATASNKSTERWTFTAGLIQALAGDPQVDANSDGVIQFAELGRYLLDRMKYRENQLASITTTSSFERDFLLRRTVGEKKIVARIPGPFQIGGVVDAKDQEGKWYASEILAWDDAKGLYRVHYYGWDSKWDEWVEPARVRALVKPKLQIGQQYEVQWQDKRWYRGTVTKAVDDWFYFVHYAGEAGEDDEWVTPERTRPLSAGTVAQKPEFAAAAGASDLKPGQIVAAQWHRQWWRGRIVAQEEGMFLVRYDDETDGRLTADELIPIPAAGVVRVGDRVLACWAGKPRMYPGQVLSLTGGKARIRWEDGSTPTDVPLNAVAPIQP